MNFPTRYKLGQTRQCDWGLGLCWKITLHWNCVTRGLTMADGWTRAT